MPFNIIFILYVSVFWHPFRSPPPPPPRIVPVAYRFCWGFYAYVLYPPPPCLVFFAFLSYLLLSFLLVSFSLPSFHISYFLYSSSLPALSFLFLFLIRLFLFSSSSLVTLFSFARSLSLSYCMVLSLSLSCFLFLSISFSLVPSGFPSLYLSVCLPFVLFFFSFRIVLSLSLGFPSFSLSHSLPFALFYFSKSPSLSSPLGIILVRSLSLIPFDTSFSRSVLFSFPSRFPSLSPSLLFSPPGSYFSSLLFSSWGSVPRGAVGVALLIRLEY